MVCLQTSRLIRSNLRRFSSSATQDGMRILLSNDDGISAIGLQALYDAISPYAEVWVVAPDREKSAASHAITLHRPLRIRERKPRWFEVDGTPTDCVYFAIHHLMRNALPDLVCAGINDGPNLGIDVLYSGTVAAATEGAILGFLSVAFSHAGEKRDFPAAASFAPALLQSVIHHPFPRGTLLNVNFPDGSPSGYAFTHLGQRNYGSSVIEKTDPRGRHYYWIGGGNASFEDIPGSDCNIVYQEKMISITPLLLDFTDHSLLESLRTWSVPGYSLHSVSPK